MLNKSFFTGAFAVLFLITVCGCASNSTKNEKPLWASDETLEMVYPNSEYIARIGRGTSIQSATSFAEGELSSYFSHSVHSQVNATQVMTDTKSGDKENIPGESKTVRSIERKVTVDSMNELFDVHLTSAWFDKKQKQYDYLLIEGAGGITCPLRLHNGEKYILKDLIKELESNIIIVADGGLGTINSTMLTVEYAHIHNINIEGIILNNFNPDSFMHQDNLKQVEYLTGIKVIATVKEGQKDIELLKDCFK